VSATSAGDVHTAMNYQSFATVGESDPTGDEKFSPFSRHGRHDPGGSPQRSGSFGHIIRGESWRTLLQTCRTKIFLAFRQTSAPRNARIRAGKEEQTEAEICISRRAARTPGSALFTVPDRRPEEQSYGEQDLQTCSGDFIFEPKNFGELKTAESIVLAYDG